MTYAMDKQFTDQADLRMYMLDLFTPDEIDVRKTHVRFTHATGLGATVPKPVRRTDYVEPGYDEQAVVRAAEELGIDMTGVGSAYDGVCPGCERTMLLWSSGKCPDCTQGVRPPS